MYEKFVLTEDGMYVGKDYLSDGLLKMNVMTIVPPIMNNKNTYVIYLFEYNFVERLLCQDKIE